MNPNDDFMAMKPEQRDKVVDAIKIAGIATTNTGNHYHWRESMINESSKSLGRVRRFYRYLASFNDNQVDDFLRGFLS